MKVRYWWSEDGVMEICERSEYMLTQDTECYHCFKMIPKGTIVYVLHPVEDNDVYHICKSCAAKSMDDKVHIPWDL